MSSPSTHKASEPPIYWHGFKWSQAEKQIARRAFERALQSELDEVMQTAKTMAAGMKDRTALWKLEGYLTRRRQEIDHEYDFRYSVLHFVFAKLIREGRLTQSDLEGLGEEKLDAIRKMLEP
jgi:hypothetical protein